MNNPIENFLTAVDEQEVIAAIVQAEQHTSGEIRVHLESSCSNHSEERTLEIFHALNMHATQKRNAVLIYVAVVDHEFTIYGDEGINAVVPSDFWDATKDIIEGYFKQGQFKNGLINGIKNIGLELKSHFPWDANDKNELTNTISKS